MWVLGHSSSRWHLPLMNWWHGSFPIGGYLEIDFLGTIWTSCFGTTGLLICSSIDGILESPSPKVWSVAFLGSRNEIPLIYSSMKLIIYVLWSSIILVWEVSCFLSSCSIRVAISMDGICALMAKAPSIYYLGTIVVAFCNLDILSLTSISLTDLFLEGTG